VKENDYVSEKERDSFIKYLMEIKGMSYSSICDTLGVNSVRDVGIFYTKLSTGVQLKFNDNTYHSEVSRNDSIIIIYLSEDKYLRASFLVGKDKHGDKIYYKTIQNNIICIKLHKLDEEIRKKYFPSL
jgi:cystathionine beta-lyase family protein involved in aluminum resistance